MPPAAPLASNQPRSFRNLLSRRKLVQPPRFLLPQGAHIGFRQRAFRLLERPQSSQAGMLFLLVLLLCIFASIAVYFISSLPGMRHDPAVKAVEYVCTIVFTVELAVRIAVGTLDPWSFLVRDWFTFLIDLGGIAPFYFELALFSHDSEERPVFLQLLQLLRLLRVLKLLRHYSGWRVLSLALERSWRAVAVPVFAMILTILVLSGLLFALEASYEVGAGAGAGAGAAEDEAAEPLANAFESMWAIFWLVTTLGFDGHMGTEQPASRLVIALALVCGLLFTTMPITVLGGAFAAAWEQKEVVEVAMKVQELLFENGHGANDVRLVFDAFDSDGSREVCACLPNESRATRDTPLLRPLPPLPPTPATAPTTSSLNPLLVLPQCSPAHPPPSLLSPRSSIGTSSRLRCACCTSTCLC